MEEKNFELNLDELEQGVGGISSRELVEKATAQMRLWKKAGKTKEEFIRDKKGQEMFRMLADRHWDDL